jgi:predicted protein tyrosine phosphatase
MAMALHTLTKAAGIALGRLSEQGLGVTLLWATDHAVRIITGAPLKALTQVTPHLRLGGQYRKRGWPRLVAQGITAVVDLRAEFDDSTAGIAPAHYLYLPTEDDHAPSLEQLHQGVEFIESEIAQRGQVYVHCGAGVGRAATMAAAYLVSTGLTPAQAWDRIRSVRPFVRPWPDQTAQVQRFAAGLHS